MQSENSTPLLLMTSPEAPQGLSVVSPLAATALSI
jgi:hypothetical protein